MKRIKLLVLLAFFAFTSNLFALDNYPFSAGLGIMAKSGINISETPDGIQNAFAIHEGLDIGAMVYMPMSEETRTGLFLEMTYANVPYGLKIYNTSEKGFTTQKWLNISPVLLMSGFLVGLDFGFNIADDWVSDDWMFPYLPFAKNGFNINIKAGGIIPIHTSNFGTLNFTAMATYNFTGAEVGDITHTPVTLGIGLNYLVNLESF